MDWAIYIAGIVLVASFFGIPLAIRMRLHARHPELYRRFVEEYVDQEGIRDTRLRQDVLLRYLFRREHKEAGDAVLSALSDVLLAGFAMLFAVLATAFAWVAWVFLMAPD